MSDFFKSFKTSKPAFLQLVEGEHVVRLSHIELLNSFQQYNGQPKDELPEWANATPQLAVTVVSAEDGKSGGLTHRFNGCGYRKFDDLSDKEIKSGKYEDIGGYACYTDQDGDRVREEDAEKTAACESIINQFANALGIVEGSDLMESLEQANMEQVKFRITVVNDEYQGKDQLRLTRPRAVKADVVADSFED